MNKNAFTLIEIAVTTVIVALLGMMAIPNLMTMINRSYSQDVMHNLIAIYGAEQNYYQNNNDAYLKCNDLNQINTSENATPPGLGLSIVSADSGTTYSCDDSAQTCTGIASSKSGSFTMVISLALPIKTQSTAVYCNGGVPDGAYNPCCTGSGTAGANCP